MSVGKSKEAYRGVDPYGLLFFESASIRFRTESNGNICRFHTRSKLDLPFWSLCSSWMLALRMMSSESTDVDVLCLRHLE